MIYICRRRMHSQVWRDNIISGGGAAAPAVDVWIIARAVAAVPSRAAQRSIILHAPPSRSCTLHTGRQSN